MSTSERRPTSSGAALTGRLSTRERVLLIIWPCTRSTTAAGMSSPRRTATSISVLSAWAFVRRVRSASKLPIATSSSPPAIPRMRGSAAVDS